MSEKSDVLILAIESSCDETVMRKKEWERGIVKCD